MRIETWWSLLGPSTQQWLIDNNGDVLPAMILDQITAVAGPPIGDATWVVDSGPQGFFLTDEASDWIEETANAEVSEEDGG